MNDSFGLLGMALIIAAWLPEIIGTVRTGKSGMKKEFIAVYFLGSASLSVYAWQIGSLPFLALNTLAAIVPLVNLFFLLQEKK